MSIDGKVKFSILGNYMVKHYTEYLPKMLIWISSVFLLLVFISGCAVEEKEVAKGEQYYSFTDDGAWCWFSDPRAVYYEGEHKRTYAGWVDSNGSIMVGYYDHDTGELKEYTLKKEYQVDDHNNPSFHITEKGKLLVFYSKHATEEPILLSKSKNPEEISDWEEPKILDLNDTTRYSDFSDTYTYTNPQYLRDENALFLYWRGSDFKPNYAVSNDMGETWSKGDIFILPDREYPERRPYVKVSSNGSDKIHFAFTQGHPRMEEDNSIYYMRYKKGAYYKADDTKIKDTTMAVRPYESSLVYDASESGAKSWIWDVASDQNEHPVIVYAKFPDDSSHIYSYARWNGKEWNNYDLVDSGKWFPETPTGEEEPEPNYSGGLALDHEDPNIVYLSVEREGVFEIEKWTTSDGGESWEKEIITKNSSNDNVRPVAIRNAKADNPLQFLWMNNEKYIHYTNYNSTVKTNLLKEN